MHKNSFILIYYILYRKKDAFLKLVKNGEPDWKNPQNRELLR